MKVLTYVGLLLLYGTCTVAGACACIVGSIQGKSPDYAAIQKCCKGSGDKLAGSFCETANQATFQTCCDSAIAATHSPPTGSSVIQCGL
ncbi:hypothetical protein CGMCC3_g13921 [Colletotrichum fructicola]|nr:uncharacterized protein CGMCC3_g13921 [Colletotrichum fructicola]KAE9570018.1 hypothetical protein CGMCC3_g13921 [Colletotrichum fructicola]